MILVVNSRLAEMLGYSKNEMINRDATNFCAEKWKEIIIKKILTLAERPFEAEGLHKDGSVFPVEIEGTQVSYKGKKVRLTIFRDLIQQYQNFI